MNGTAAGGFAALLGLAWYALLFGSAIWVGLDARKRDFSRSKFANKTWQWVVGAIFLWIIVVPVYLLKRGNAPLKSA
jgi:hypothetical protein